MGVLRIRRPAGLADALRKYRIVVGGTEVGEVAAGGELQLDLPVGRHTVVARIDWCSSNTVTLDVEAQSWQELEVGSPLRGWRLSLGVLYVFFWPSQYLYLRPV